METQENKLSRPQEMPVMTQGSRPVVSIGLPRENPNTEKRLALTPEAVDMIVGAGHRVLLEAGAGEGINYSDAAYSEAGAEISSCKNVFASDLIFKIAPPTIAEIALMKRRATVCSSLQLSAMSGEMFQQMAAKSISAMAFELMSADGRNFPVRNSISEIEGAAAIALASELLSNEHGGKGILVGGVPGVPPAEVVIAGAGVAGTVAARAALALGALVRVFDNDILKLRNLQSELGSQVFTSVFQPNVLFNAFRSADVVIGAMRFIDDSVRYVISEEVTAQLKRGAVVIDLRTGLGGCFETTCMLPTDHPRRFEKKGVIYYCAHNLSSRVARTTSMALSNVFTPYIMQISPSGGLADLLQTDPMLRQGHYIYAGKPVNQYVARRFNLSAHDIGLFLSSN
jgi:alanine dehydrogenase